MLRDIERKAFPSRKGGGDNQEGVQAQLTEVNGDCMLGEPSNPFTPKTPTASRKRLINR